MDFKNANELLTLCEEQNISISEVMRNREIITGECPAKEADQKMARVLEIMKEAARSPIEKPIRSMGGLIGGEAQKLAQHSASGQGLCGELLEKAITYAMATLETNASMGLIVASPTAGSAGIVPGLLLAFQEVYHFSDKEIQQVLFNAGAVGYLAMRNATVAGAVGGCQAEVGVASVIGIVDSSDNSEFFFGLNDDAISGVQIGPGATAFTRIPFSTRLADKLLVKEIIAPLVEA